jgi:hypothetical protein
MDLLAVFLRRLTNQAVPVGLLIVVGHGSANISLQIHHVKVVFGRVAALASLASIEQDVGIFGFNGTALGGIKDIAAVGLSGKGETLTELNAVIAGNLEAIIAKLTSSIIVTFHPDRLTHQHLMVHRTTLGLSANGKSKRRQDNRGELHVVGLPLFDG